MLDGDTEECTLALDALGTCSTTFVVLDLPAYVNADFDGLVGWWTLSHCVMRIDAVARKVSFLPKAPKQVAQWAQLSIIALTNSGALDLQIPHADHSDGVLCIDTGASLGLVLPAQEWHRWKAAHPDILTTLDTIFTPSDGFCVCEQAWADQISIGPIVLTGVPIMAVAGAGARNWGSRWEGTLGIAALKRLDLIADGKTGVAYLRGKKTPPPAYSYNRLGAIFVPMNTRTNQAVARVVPGGPAYDAGVRDGDILLQVNELLVKSWNGSWRVHFCLPAGTKLRLTLNRDGKIFTTTATLREILRRSSDKYK
jgi:hypothetical protein